MGMRRLDDGELWGRVQRGDPQAFAELFERHAGAVYTYCFRRTADWSVAEELISVVFLEAWRRRATQLAPAKVLPWLLGVATNVLRNQHRSLRRYNAALSRLPPLEPERDFAEDVAERLADQQRMRELLNLIARLPQGEQEVLALCLWQGCRAKMPLSFSVSPKGPCAPDYSAREHACGNSLRKSTPTSTQTP
jgi:RNA polymerase sigma factor (sigma-70 family)